VADVLVNIILFIPLGAALGSAGIGGWRAVGFGAALSGAVEFAQLFIPGRDSSLGDVCTNTAGAFLGWALARWAAGVLRSPRRPPAWSGGAAAGLALAVILATGLLLHGAFPATAYFSMWTPDLGHLEFYRGRVLRASFDSVALPPEELSPSARARELLARGATLRVRALAGPHPAGLAPLFSIYDDRQQEILLLGPDRHDLVFRYRTRAASHRLDAPDIRLARAMDAVRPGDTLDIEVRRVGNGYCVRLNASTTCGLGFSAGNGWALLEYPPSLPRWLKGLLNVGWVAGLWLPAGFYGASRWGSLAVVVVAVVALAIVAPAAGLVATPLGQWAGTATGILAGAGSREAIIRHGRSRRIKQ